MPASPEITSKIENKEYRIDRLTKSNLKDLAVLHSEVYRVPVDETYFFKKYDTAYTGQELVGYLAFNPDEKAVAYYGVIPCFIKYNGEVILAAQSADTMTHPNYRYKGIFVDLSNKAFDLCRQLGIRLVFGFPNQNSYHGAVNKVGWKFTETMACFAIPVKSLPLESAARRMRLSGWYKRYAQFVFKKNLLSLHGTASSVIVDGFAGVYRNEEYFVYKTYNASRVIKIGDAKVWISNRSGLFIGDMEKVDETNFEFIIDKLKDIARKLGVTRIQFHCSPGITLHRLFSRKFESTPSYPVLFQDFGTPVPPEKIKFTFADIDIF